MPITVEPTKPRMCHDERFLNVWIKDLSLSLDYISGLPRYVFKSHFQTTFGDKSGYDHIRLSPDSFTFVGLEWKGWHFCYDFTLWLEGQCLHLSYGWLSGYESYLLSWCSLQSVGIFTIDMSANSLYTKIYNVLSNGPIFNLLKPLPLFCMLGFGSPWLFHWPVQICRCSPDQNQAFGFSI